MYVEESIFSAKFVNLGELVYCLIQLIGHIDTHLRGIEL